MGMSNYILGNEEMFYGTADDVKLECDNMDQFLEMMMTQKDLVSHISDDDIIDTLKEIWHG